MFCEPLRYVARNQWVTVKIANFRSVPSQRFHAQGGHSIGHRRGHSKGGSLIRRIRRLEWMAGTIRMQTARKNSGGCPGSWNGVQGTRVLVFAPFDKSIRRALVTETE